MALCDVRETSQRGYFTHIRDESNKVIEAVDEAIDIARACGIHVEIVHLKCSGVDNWGKADALLADDRRREGAGATSTATRIPIPRAANPLKNLLPPWVQVGGTERCWSG